MVRIVNMGEVARRAAGSVPGIILAVTGVVFATMGAAAQGPSGPQVPSDLLASGASPLYPSAGPAPAPMQLPPIYRTYVEDPARIPVPRGAQEAIHAVDSPMPVRIDADGIPAPALAAYRRAADLLGSADPACGLDWALLGAIGRVESNHARFAGNVLDAGGVARPGIIGIPLDGTRGTARITDTDHGRWDRDTSYDRAVGPMQLIPGTWREVGQDGSGDGIADPQNMADAATSAGAYLCSGSTHLADRAHAYQAVLRYNHSDAYARTVLAIAEAYRTGVTVLPMDALPAARPAQGSGTGTPEGSGFAWAGSPRQQPTSGGTAPRSQPSSNPTTRPPTTSKASPTAHGSSTGPGAPAPTASRTGRDPLPSVRLPGASAPLPAPSAAPSSTSLGVTQLLALPPLPPLLGDPAGLVRVLDPASGEVVCLLDQRIVACP